MGSRQKTRQNVVKGYAYYAAKKRHEKNKQQPIYLVKVGWAFCINRPTCSMKKSLAMRLSLRAAHHTPPLPPVSLSRVLEQFSDTFHKQQPDVLLNSTFCKTELPQYQCGHITPLFQRLCNIICPCHSESYAPGFKVKLTEQSSLDANVTIMNLHPTSSNINSAMLWH